MSFFLITRKFFSKTNFKKEYFKKMLIFSTILLLYIHFLTNIFKNSISSISYQIHLYNEEYSSFLQFMVTKHLPNNLNKASHNPCEL